MFEVPRALRFWSRGEPVVPASIAYELLSATLTVVEKLLEGGGDGVAPAARKLRDYVRTARVEIRKEAAQAALEKLDDAMWKVRNACSQK